MVAYNFAAEHAPKVENRTKKRTLRLEPRAKVGDKLQLFTGQRTAQCRKLSQEDPTCTRVAKVELTRTDMKYDGTYQSPDILDDYARADGFKGYQNMLDWFEAQYGVIPEVLWETRWDWPTPPVMEGGEK